MTPPLDTTASPGGPPTAPPGLDPATGNVLTTLMAALHQVNPDAARALQHSMTATLAGSLPPASPAAPLPPPAPVTPPDAPPDPWTAFLGSHPATPGTVAARLRSDHAGTPLDMTCTPLSELMALLDTDPRPAHKARALALPSRQSPAFLLGIDGDSDVVVLHSFAFCPDLGSPTAIVALVNDFVGAVPPRLVQAGGSADSPSFLAYSEKRVQTLEQLTTAFQQAQPPAVCQPAAGGPILAMTASVEIHPLWASVFLTAAPMQPATTLLLVSSSKQPCLSLFAPKPSLSSCGFALPAPVGTETSLSCALPTLGRPLHLALLLGTATIFSAGPQSRPPLLPHQLSHPYPLPTWLPSCSLWRLPWLAPLGPSLLLDTFLTSWPISLASATTVLFLKVMNPPWPS